MSTTQSDEKTALDILEALSHASSVVNEINLYSKAVQKDLKLSNETMGRVYSLADICRLLKPKEPVRMYKGKPLEQYLSEEDGGDTVVYSNNSVRPMENLGQDGCFFLGTYVPPSWLVKPTVEEAKVVPNIFADSNAKSTCCGLNEVCDTFSLTVGKDTSFTTPVKPKEAVDDLTHKEGCHIEACGPCTCGFKGKIFGMFPPVDEERPTPVEESQPKKSSLKKASKVLKPQLKTPFIVSLEELKNETVSLPIPASSEIPEPTPVELPKVDSNDIDSVMSGAKRVLQKLCNIKGIPSETFEYEYSEDKPTVLCVKNDDFNETTPNSFIGIGGRWNVAEKAWTFSANVLLASERNAKALKNLGKLNGNKKSNHTGAVDIRDRNKKTK